MPSNNIKKVLEDLKKQVSGLNYYLASVKVIEKDRKSVSNLNYAKMTINDMVAKLERNIRDIEQSDKAISNARIDDKYRTVLATINSPTKEMIRASETNNIIRQSTLNRNKKAVASNEEKGQAKKG